MRPAFTISYLELTTDHKKPQPALTVLRASPLPMAYFRAMYQETGRNYYWIDQLNETDEELAAYCGDQNKTMYSLIVNGAPAGFFVLHDQNPIVDITYFGLLFDVHGLGLGGQWLDYAIAEAWATQGCKKVTLNTCTLDHPRALPLYLSRGFEVTHTKESPAIS